MSTALVSSPRSQAIEPLRERTGIPACVISAVHFRKDFDRLLDTLSIPDRVIPKLLLLDLESSKAESVLSAIKGLSPLFETVASKEQFNDFVSLGGHTLFVTALRKWMDHDVKIVAYCCCCIARMIQKYEIGDRTLHIARPLRLAGCIDHVVSALLKHKSSKDVQRFGIAALGNLCSGSHSYEDASLAARRLVYQLNGVTVVVEASNLFSNEESIQEVMCCFLARLCFLELGDEPVMKDKALIAVSEAVRRFPENRPIEKNAAYFMAAVLHP